MYQFTIDHFGCQICKERINCIECEKHIKDMLLRIKNFQNVEISIASKQIRIDTEQLSEDAAINCLEEIGLVVL